jgi:hypothetical protein
MEGYTTARDPADFALLQAGADGVGRWRRVHRLHLAAAHRRERGQFAKVLLGGDRRERAAAARANGGKRAEARYAHACRGHLRPGAGGAH